MMPRPNKSNKKNYDNPNYQSTNHERVLLETKPNMFLYSDNFIFKFIVLFLLVFLFAPILTVVHSIQMNLQTSFQINFTNMTFISEMIVIFCILIVLIKILLDILDWNYTKYTLTSNRIVIQRGFIRKEKISMPYSKVQDIDVSRSIIERIFGTGNLIIYGGHDNTETILDEIPNPTNAEEIILRQMDNTNYNQVPYQQTQPQPQPQEEIIPDNYQNNNQRDYSEHNHYENNNNNQPKYNGYKAKWRKNKINKTNQENNELGKDEILKRHQENFKKYNK